MEEIQSLLQEAGFEDVKVEVAFELMKTVENQGGESGEEKKEPFPFLICTGRKAYMWGRREERQEEKLRC